MKSVYRFKVEKLIRSKLPEIMRGKGIRTFERVLDEHEYTQSLKKKLLEEAEEVVMAEGRENMVEELADLQEVIIALGDAFRISSEEVESARIQKKQERGGFEARIYNAFVEMDVNNKNATYYLDRPDQYPETGQEQS